MGRYGIYPYLFLPCDFAKILHLWVNVSCLSSHPQLFFRTLKPLEKIVFDLFLATFSLWVFQDPLSPAKQLLYKFPMMESKTECAILHIEGKTFRVPEGKNLAAALLENGKLIFGRSMKFHRARAPQCFTGECSHCMVTVNNRPNTRACQVQCRGNMYLTRQNAWPSADYDLLSLVGSSADYLGPAFHYYHFMDPSFLYSHYIGFLRKMAGFGRYPEEPRPGEPPLPQFEPPLPLGHLKTVIIGGGPAGIGVLETLQRFLPSEPVTLFESLSCLGGKEGGIAKWKEFENRFRNNPHLSLKLETTVVGAYPDHKGGPTTFLALGREGGHLNPRLITFNCENLFLAPGSTEKLPLFKGNDLPGIFSSQALKYFIPKGPWTLYGLDQNLSDTFHNSSLEKKITDQKISKNSPILLNLVLPPFKNPNSDLPLLIKKFQEGPLFKKGVLKMGECFFDSYIAKAGGKNQINSISLLKGVRGEEIILKTQALFYHLGSSPRVPLPLLLGYEGKYDPDSDSLKLESSPEGYPLGERKTGTEKVFLTGMAHSKKSVRENFLCGHKRALFFINSKNIFPQRGELSEVENLCPLEADKGVPAPFLSGFVSSPLPLDKKTIVCHCEDVPLEELDHAIRGGLNHIESLKRFTSCGMGACRGQSCSLQMLEVLRQHPQGDPNAREIIKSRPPIEGVPFGCFEGLPDDS